MQDRSQLSPVQFRHFPLILKALILALVSLAVLSGGALAHPPSDVTMTYDQNTGDLIVTIPHQVDDPKTHYVKQVTVKQGDTVLIDKSYTSQPDRSSFTYRYNLPQLKASSGEIRVDAQCNLFGSRSGTLPLGPNPANTASASPAAPAPTKSPVGVLITLVAIGFVARKILR